MRSRRSEPPSQGPYRALYRDSPSEHPVEALLEHRLPQRGLRRRIRKASERLLRALGDRTRCWLELEELLSEYHVRREQTHFDLGVEHGYAAARAAQLRLGRGAAGARALTERVFELALSAGLSPETRALALLEAAWAVGFQATDQHGQHEDPRGRA